MNAVRPPDAALDRTAAPLEGGGEPRFLRNPYLQIFLSLVHRGAPVPTGTQRKVLIPIEGGRLEAVIGESGIRPVRQVVILLHGLAGCALSSYMCRTAESLVRSGAVALRVTLRDHARTQHLSRPIYHAARAEDLFAVFDWALETWPQAELGVIAFSLGGTTLLKGLGELSASAPERLTRAVAVCPPLDLACAERRLRVEIPWAGRYFLRRLKAMYEEKAAAFPELYPAGLARPAKTLREFDELVSAPLAGFASAGDYYRKASPRPWLSRIRVPVLVISSRDDPIVCGAEWEDVDAELGGAPVRVLVTRYGGHVGFLAWDFTRPDPLYYWAEETAVRWVLGG